jgi:hypothetical protein
VGRREEIVANSSEKLATLAQVPTASTLQHQHRLLAIAVGPGQRGQQGAVDAPDAVEPIGQCSDSGQLCGQMAEGIR